MRQLLFIVLLCFVLSAKAQVVINELGIAPSAGNPEFIELYNKSSCPVDLSCYTLIFSGTSGGGNPTGWTVKFPAGKSIAACGVFLIGGLAGTGGVSGGTGFPTGGTPTSYAAADLNIGTASITANAIFMKQGIAAGTLPNGSGQVSLLNNTGNVVASVSYNNGNNPGTYPLSTYLTCNTTGNIQGVNTVLNPGPAPSVRNVTATFSAAGVQGVALHALGSYIATNVLTPGSPNASQAGCAPSITPATSAAPLCFSHNSQSTTLSYGAISNNPTTYSITWNSLPANNFIPVSNEILSSSPISIQVPAATAPGMYTGYLTVTNDIGSNCAPVPFTITINPLPVLEAGNYGPICMNNGSISLTGQPVGGIFSGPGVSGSVFIPPAAGTFQVLYDYLDLTTGCSNKDSSNIVVNGLPVINVNPAAINKCQNESGVSLTAGGASTYLWSPASGLNTIIGSTVMANPLTTTSYSVAGTDVNGCTGSASGVVTVMPSPPTPQILVTQPTCSPFGTIHFSTPSGTGFFYSIDGTNYLNNNGVFNNVIPGNYVATVRNSAGCISSPVQVIIEMPPVPVVTVNSPIVCPGTIATMVATPAVADSYTYSWNVPAGVNNPGNVASFATAVAGIYSVTITNVDGCSYSASGILSFNTLPIILADDKQVCAGNVVSLTGQPAGGSWSGFGVIGAQFDASSLPAGTYTVDYIYSAGTCSGSATAIVTVHTIPSTPVVQVTNLCNGLSTLSATNYSGSLQWSTGATTPVIQVNTAGVYHLTQTVNGCSSTAVSTMANPGSSPVAPVISSIQQPDCLTSTGSFTIASPAVNGLSYSIDGISYTNISGQFSGLPSGTYSVTVRNTTGCISLPTSVVINQPPIPPVAPTLQIVQPDCFSGFGSIIIQSPIAAGLAYSIDGINYQSSIIFSNLTPGDYLVRVRSSDGCITPSSIITINPVNGLVVTEMTTCIQEGSYYQFNGQALSATGNYTTTFTRPGLCDSLVKLFLLVSRTESQHLDGCGSFLYNGTNYNSSVTIRDTITSTITNCDSVYRVVTITIKPEIISDVSVCLVAGQTFTFNGLNLTAGGFYTTRFTSSTGCDSTVNLSLTITKLEEQDIMSCDVVIYKGLTYSTSTTLTETILSQLTLCDSVVRKIKIIVAPKPVISLSPDLTICRGDSVRLTATAGNNLITWIGIGTGNTITVSPASTTVVTATAMSANGCVDTAHTTIMISDFDVQLTASSNPVIAGMEVQLSTTAASSYQVLSWQPAFTNAKAKQQLFVADTAMLVKVIAQSIAGCIATDSVFLFVDPLNDVYIPDAFTPNGDGRNDYFLIGGGHFTAFDLKVFNRWGQIVFSTKERSKGWNGSVAGKEQSSGTYIYILNATSKDGKQIKRTGTITIIR